MESRPAVVVIESDDLVAEMLLDLLHSAGFAATRASTAATAQSLLDDQVMVALIDCSAPSRALREALAQADRLRLPVIAMSTDPRHADWTGPRPFLAKPFSVSALMQLVMTSFQWRGSAHAALSSSPLRRITKYVQ